VITPERLANARGGTVTSQSAFKFRHILYRAKISNMANRRIGHIIYFKVLEEIERQIAERGDFGYQLTSRVTEIDHRTIKGFYEVGFRAIPTRGLRGLPPIRDIIEGKAPRPEGAPPVPFTPLTEKAPVSQPMDMPPPVPLPTPPPLPYVSAPLPAEEASGGIAGEEPQPGGHLEDHRHPRQETGTDESAPAPPQEPPSSESSKPFASQDERSSLIKEMIRQSEHYIESREFQSMAVKHVRGGVQALEAAQNAALGINVMCQKLLHALEPAFDRLGYDIAVRLNDGERIPTKDLAEALTAIAKAAQASGTELKGIQEAKQLLLGGPTEIVRLACQAAPVLGPQQASDPGTDALVTSLLQGRLLGAAPAYPEEDEQERENVIDIDESSIKAGPE
jgi:hypothetical protein